MGLLPTLGITLATDTHGPVANNAGGIAGMAARPAVVRECTDALNSLGNTTAATGKGFAIGSAVLKALALLAAYAEATKSHSPRPPRRTEPLEPETTQRPSAGRLASLICLHPLL